MAALAKEDQVEREEEEKEEQSNKKEKKEEQTLEKVEESNQKKGKHPLYSYFRVKSPKNEVKLFIFKRGQEYII